MVSPGDYPWATIILVSVLTVFNIPLLFIDSWQVEAINVFGFIPIDFSVSPLKNSYTLITANALHGDVFHLAGNCMFLIVFGRTLERLFGSVMFLWVFPLLGTAGFLFHWVIYADSNIPVIGASGAISALMGAYLLLFPKAKIKLIATLGYFWKRITIPAYLFLPYWGGMQLLSAVFGYNEGIAYAVHVGSFVFGMIGAIMWKTSYPMAEDKLTVFIGESFQ